MIDNLVLTFPLVLNRAMFQVCSEHNVDFKSLVNGQKAKHGKWIADSLDSILTNTLDNVNQV